MTITEFLLARIAEDEAVANGYTADQWGNPYSDGSTYDFDERFTPASVLAECEAKRRIVELHEPCGYYGWRTPPPVEPKAWYCETCQCEDGVINDHYPCYTAKVMAAVYAQHPDYDEAWAL